MKKGLDGLEESVRADLEELREEYERGMRFVHVISMQLKQDLYDTVTQMSAFIDAAAENGVVEREDLEKRYESSRQREYERIRSHAVVQIAEPSSATPVVTGDALDCQSRLHLCKARCCTFDVTLSTEDLDKGVIRWDYGRPYKLKSELMAIVFIAAEGTVRDVLPTMIAPPPAKHTTVVKTRESGLTLKSAFPRLRGRHNGRRKAA